MICFGAGAGFAFQQTGSMGFGAGEVDIFLGEDRFRLGARVRNGFFAVVETCAEGEFYGLLHRFYALLSDKIGLGIELVDEFVFFIVCGDHNFALLRKILGDVDHCHLCFIDVFETNRSHQFHVFAQNFGSAF